MSLVSAAFFFFARSPYAAQDDLKLTILLPQSPLRAGVTDMNHRALLLNYLSD
jgi:hypothetical protein